MSLATLLRTASTQAQSTLAQMQGMPAGATNVLYNGATYTGVFGPPTVLDDPNAAGGYRRSAILPLTITRAQFDSPPVAKKRVTRTDISPPIEYLIDSVDTHDPIHYVLMLVKNG